MPDVQVNHDLLRDGRAKLLVLLMLAAAHIVGGAATTYVLVVMVAVVMSLQRSTLSRTWGVLAGSAAVVALVCLIVWYFSSAMKARQITFDLVRLLSLAALTLVLALSMSILELAAALRWFRLPRGIVLALAVGLRFLPVIAEELRRTALIRRQRGATLRSMMRRFGPVGAISRVFSPLIIAMIRRVDAILVAVHVRGLLHRIENHTFRPVKLIDKLAVAVSSLVVAVSIIERAKR